MRQRMYTHRSMLPKIAEQPKALEPGPVTGHLLISRQQVLLVQFPKNNDTHHLFHLLL